MEPSGRREALLKVKLRIVMKRHYPGLTREQVSEAITDVEKANGGKLVGLNYKKLFTLMKPFLRKNAEKEKETDRKEKLDQQRLEATCSVCFTMFVEKFSRDRHMRLMHKDKHTKEVIMDNCGDGKDEINLELNDDHDAVTTEEAKIVNEDAVEECSECGKLFKHKTSLKRHMKIHKDAPETFPCDTCSKSFKRKDILFKHCERVHNLYNVNMDALRKSFQTNAICQMCGKDFREDHNMFETHLVDKVCMNKDKIIEINKDMKFQCDLCEKSYSHKDELNRHFRWKHTSKQTTFKCNECSASYSSKSSLNRHVKKLHGVD